jgi:hypothetical protein
VADGGEQLVRVTYNSGDVRSSELTVRLGTDIAITLNGSAGYAWAAITGTADGTADGPLSLVRAGTEGGSTWALVRAEHEGEAELRSTSSFGGDRFGPQTLLWRLRVRVTG